MKFIGYVLAVYLILLMACAFSGFTYQVEAELSPEQAMKLDQVQAELKKTVDVTSLSYGSGILTIRSTEKLSDNDVGKLAEKAEKFTPVKTDKEKARDYLKAVNINDDTKFKEIVKSLAELQR